jgi:hypothetical protein
MTESPRGARAGTARDYLEAARARLGKDHRVQRAADYGLRLLSRLLDEVRGEIDGWEMAELTAVYDTLALLVADALGLGAADAFRSLAVICGDEDALRLTRGQPEPDQAFLRLLHDRVLWVTVTYESEPRGQSRRVTEVAYKNAAGNLWAAKATVNFAYEDLPGRVRGRMLTGGQRAVRYQLYPAPAPGPAATHETVPHQAVPDGDVAGGGGRKLS